MKRIIALAALAAACCLCASAEDVAYEYKLPNATPKPNDQVTSVTGITMTYCVGGGDKDTGWDKGTVSKAKDDASWTGTDWSEYVYYSTGKKVQSVGNDSIPTAGSYLKFAPTKAGTLLILTYAGKNTVSQAKTKVVKKDGETTTMVKSKLLDTDGSEYKGGDDSHNVLICFDVEASKEYIVYEKDSQLDFFGFAFGLPSVKTTPNGFCTWSYTQPTALPANTRLYTVKLDEGGSSVTPTPSTATVVPSYTGVMMKHGGGKQVTLFMKPTTGGGSDAFANNSLLPTWESKSQSADSTYYVLGYNSTDAVSYFGQYNPQKQLNANRAYIAVGKSASNAKSLSIAWEEDEDGTTTTVTSHRQPAEADIAPIYNLHGQRTANPTKGIYVRNGKKFVAK